MLKKKKETHLNCDLVWAHNLTEKNSLVAIIIQVSCVKLVEFRDSADFSLNTLVSYRFPSSRAITVDVWLAKKQAAAKKTLIMISTIRYYMHTKKPVRDTNTRQDDGHR